MSEVELITANTGVAVTTATRRLLTLLQTFILRGATQGNHTDNHYMSGNPRILRKPLFVIDHLHVFVVLWCCLESVEHGWAGPGV